MVRVRHKKKYIIIKPVIHQEGSMQFNRNYLVHYYEAGADRRLTLPALIQYFEDIAILHSTERGLDLDYYEKNHCGWMLIKWDVKVHALPCFGETVLVETRVHAMKSFMADREFRMRAEDGTILAEKPGQTGCWWIRYAADQSAFRKTSWKISGDRRSEGLCRHRGCSGH